MDKEVLVRFIQMIETILSRVNSKRLMTLYGVLFWLYEVKDTVGPNWTAGLGGTLSLIVIWSFISDSYHRKEAPSDDLAGTEPPKVP